MTAKNIELLENESLTKKLINKWFWLYFFWYLTAPLRYITRLIISNTPEVSVANFWLMYSVMSLITILYTYNDLWLTESLQYFLPKFLIRKEYNNIKTAVRFSLTIEAITWIIISTWLWFWSNWLSIHYFHDESASIILKYFCFYFIWTNILQILQSIFKAFQRTFEVQFTEFIKALSILVLTIFFFFSDGNIESYSLARILWLWTTIIIALLLYKKYHTSLMKWIFCLKEFILKDYVNYTLRAFVWIWIWWFFWQIILQLVVYFLWTENAWYYSNFLSLYSIGITILRPIKTLLYPLTTEYIEKWNTQAIEKLISIFYNYFSIITLSVVTLFITLWPETSKILFWEKYLLSWILLSYSWVFLLLNLLASFNNQILTWLWKVKERVYIIWVACITTIIVAIIWIKMRNIYWACIAFWISNLINRTLSFYLLKKEKFKLKTNRTFIIKNVILFTILWLVIRLLKHYIMPIDWSRLLILPWLIIFIIIYYFIIWAINKNEIKKCRSIYKM